MGRLDLTGERLLLELDEEDDERLLDDDPLLMGHDVPEPLRRDVLFQALLLLLELSEDSSYSPSKEPSS